MVEKPLLFYLKQINEQSTYEDIYFVINANCVIFIHFTEKQQIENNFVTLALMLLILFKKSGQRAQCYLSS